MGGGAGCKRGLNHTLAYRPPGGGLQPQSKPVSHPPGGSTRGYDEVWAKCKVAGEAGNPSNMGVGYKRTINIKPS